jgi:hypothetical protein
LTVDHIVFREAAEAEGTVFAHACQLGPRRDRVEARRKPILARDEPQLVEARNPGFVRTRAPRLGEWRGAERILADADTLMVFGLDHAENRRYPLGRYKRR